MRLLVGMSVGVLYLMAVVVAVHVFPEFIDAVNGTDSTRADEFKVETVRVDPIEEYRKEQAQEALEAELKRQSEPILVAEVPDASTATRRSEPIAVDGVRQQSALDPQLVMPGNFEYLGGIRPPSAEGMRSKFAYGGWGITYYSEGDPYGPDDGFPGSLYLVGFQPEQRVAELSIPAPRRSSQIDNLSVAETLQPLGDITGGLQGLLTGDSSEPFEIGGMQVVSDRLHWTLFKYYNVAGHDYASHAVSPLKIDAEHGLQGLWHLGPMGSGDPQWHSYKHAGYIAEIPDATANQWLSGRNLMSGLQISTGLTYSSQGPALFAYRLPESALPPDSSLDALPLLWYTQEQPLHGHHPADRWTGAAWVTLGGKQSVVIAGRKAHGEVFYGEPRPGDCYPYKGYHGSAYEAQLLFYSPDDLIDVAKGDRSARQIQPRYRWDSRDTGGGIDRFMFRNCRRDIGGMTYDRARNILYIVEVGAGVAADNPYEEIPVIHVFRIVE